jgi:FkbM family methyltransferase
MHLASRIFKFFGKALQIAGLGWGISDRADLFASYFFYSALRMLRGNYADRVPHRIFINVDGVRAPLYIKGLLDLYILDGIVGQREYEVAFPGTPHTIFDLGANTGIASVFFKARYPEAKLYVFEPDPNNEAILRKNLSPFSNDVTLYLAAVVGKRVPEIDFHVSNEHWSSSLLRKKDSDQVMRIRAVTLDDVMADHSLKKIDILKFDIEGAEFDVFEHFSGVEKVSHVVGEVHMDLAGKSEEAFFKLLPGFTLSWQPLHGGRITLQGSHLVEDKIA